MADIYKRMMEEFSGLEKPSKQILKEGTYQYGGIINMKDQMGSGKFDPDNPDIHIAGWGVLPLKSLHKWIAKHLKDIANYAGTVSDRTAKNMEYELYQKHSPLMHKIKALNEVWEYMKKPQYKRAVTMYKNKRR